MASTFFNDDPRSDEELVAAANEGDAAAFGALYRRHRDWVVSIAYRFTRDAHAAQDVTQECFIYLLKKFPGFEMKAKIRTLLYTAAKNRAIDRARKLRRLQGDEGVFEALAAPPVREVGEEGLLAAVLEKLPDHQREVLVLRFVEGFQLGEIARAMEIPVGTVKSRLHLGLKALRADPRTRKLLEG